MAQQRPVTITLRDRQTTGGSIPSDAVFGEPFINLYDGVLRFSGVTGGSYEPSTQSGIFEAGSVLYNQRITNRLNINNNFIISGDTGKISTYQGTSALAGKFLSGTSTGFVIADIAEIATSTDSYTTGATWVPNTLTLKLNLGKPDVTVSIGTFNTLVATGNTSLANLTATGNTSLQSVSATTIISGSTNLYSIFAPFGTVSGVETVVAGSNITTGGTILNPTVSVVASPSFNGITFSGTAIGGTVQAGAGTFTSLSAGTLSGGTILSGSTNLYSIFATPALVVNNVNAGSNITTGGTATSPTINLTASPSVNNITYSGTSTGGSSIATNVSATTFYSAATNLETVIYNIVSSAGPHTFVQPGSNITTGGTAANPIISVVASPSFNSITASGASSFTTLSATTFISGSTNLYSIFARPELVVNNVNAGSNITTGGTAISPTINLAASPSVNNLTVSGTGTIDTVNAKIITATAITDSNLVSGQAVYASTGGLLKTSSGFTYDDAVSRLFAQNIQVGSAALSGSVTIWGDVTVIGQSISAFTSQLYIEDNNIQLNYNPTASTTSTSLGAGFTIQDGSGLVGTDVFLDIRGTATGVANRAFSTNLENIRVGETGTVSSPNGYFLIKEYDLLDGGSY